MSELIDTDALAALIALRRPGKPDLVARVIALFQGETPKLLQSISDGFERRDLDAIRVASHTLKSSAAYVGARDLSEQCARLERAAREGNLVDCTLAGDGLDELFVRTLDALPVAVARAA